MQPTPPVLPPSGPSQAGAPNPAQAGGIAILVCAALLLIGTVTKSWLTQGHGDFKIGIGLLGFEACSDGHCESVSWGDRGAKSVKGDIKMFGYLGFLGGLGSTVVATVFGVFALTRKPQKIKAPLGLIFFIVTAAAMLLFVVRVMGEKGPSPDPSFSLFLGLGGAIGALVVLMAMLVPAAKRAGGGMPAAMPYPMGQPMPMQGMPMQGMPMQGQPMAAPPCPRCGAPSQYVAQYQRWFCGRCQQYV